MTNKATLEELEDNLVKLLTQVHIDDGFLSKSFVRDGLRAYAKAAKEEGRKEARACTCTTRHCKHYRSDFDLQTEKLKIQSARDIGRQEVLDEALSFGEYWCSLGVPQTDYERGKREGAKHAIREYERYLKSLNKDS